MAIIRSILILLLISCSLPLVAQVNYSNLEFIENRGQWDGRIGYKVDFGNGSFFLQKKGFTVLLHDQKDMNRILDAMHGHDSSSSTKKNVPVSPFGAKAGSNASAKNPFDLVVHSHAYIVNFENANENAEIVPDKPLPTYNNYFIGNDPSKWAADCKIYQGITYKNIYPNIDLRYYTDEGKIKYNLVVHPGANPDMIRMKYTGANKLMIKNNQLITHTTVGDVKELSPFFLPGWQERKNRCGLQIQDRP